MLLASPSLRTHLSVSPALVKWPLSTGAEIGLCLWENTCHLQASHCTGRGDVREEAEREKDIARLWPLPWSYSSPPEMDPIVVLANLFLPFTLDSGRQRRYS